MNSLAKLAKYQTPVSHIALMESLCRGGLRVITRHTTGRHDSPTPRMEKVDRVLVRRDWIDPNTAILCVPVGTQTAQLDCLPTSTDAVIPVEHIGASIGQADRMSRMIQSCFREYPDAVLALVQSGMVTPITRANLGLQ